MSTNVNVILSKEVTPRLINESQLLKRECQIARKLVKLSYLKELMKVSYQLQELTGNKKLGRILEKKSR